jgi:regulator of sigma E protease
MDFLFSVLAFAVILIPAIIIHELGHFFAAKMVGINVLEFGIGFPPRAKSLFFWGETEFTLNWLPIGGFVRPLGEDMIGPVENAMPEDYSDEEKAKHSSYLNEREELIARGVPPEKLMSVSEAKPLPRIWFMAAGATFNIVSAFIFFIITALFGIPLTMGARLMVSDIPANSVFAQSEVSPGDAIELVNGEYFESQSDFFAIWRSSSESLELTMRHPDDYEDEELAGERYTITVTPPSNLNLTAYIMISSVLEDSPAEEAGLLAGDLIYSINGEALDLNDPLEHIYDATEEFAGRELKLGIIRGSERINVSLIPRENPPRNQGRMGVGIQASWQSSDGIVYKNAPSQIEYVPQSFDAAVGYAANRLGMVMKMLWELPGQLISGAIAPEQARPVSIIGISQLGGQFLQDNIRSRSIWMILDFMGLISIFLGVTNLLPIPALDGGRIFFVLIELLRGKPVPAHIENTIHRFGFYILIAFGVIVMLMDIFMPMF